MGLLDGKTALIFGVANDHSIAWGIAQALHAEGAEVGFSSVESLIEKRVRPLATSIGSTFVEPCDVQSDERDRARLRALGRDPRLARHPRPRAGVREARGPRGRVRRHVARRLRARARRLGVLAGRAHPRGAATASGSGSSIITLTYYGAEKVVANYNVMGVAKAALEASVRYLAADLGPDGVRVNAISAGPVRTLAAAGIAGFKGMYRGFADVAPLRANITPEDVGRTAVYLASDLSSAVTGEILYVDGGFNIMGVPTGD